jgi:hypothetical protein
MTSVDLHRRRALLSVPWLTMLALGSPWARWAAARPALGGALENLLPDTDSAVAVGRAYLRHHPGERDQKRVQYLLSGALGGHLDTLDPGVLRARVRDRVRQDFAESRTAIVDGWILSITEARLCALVALISSAILSRRPGGR